MFVINGADWDFATLTADQIEKLLDQALSFVDVSRSRGEDVVIGDDFQTRAMLGTLSIWDLFGSQSPVRLRRELLQELTAWLATARCYTDAADWPDGIDDTVISIGGVPDLDNPDVTWAHCSMLAGQSAACFTFGESVVAETKTAFGTTKVHFVADETNRTRFWREMIVFHGDSLESLIRHASHAYPHLYFVEGTLQHAGQLGGGYIASKGNVQRALSTLDDWGGWAFTWPPPALRPNEGAPLNANARPSNQVVRDRFTGFGIDAAPENPNVRTHAASREARETFVGTRRLYCEWHVKLEPHRNRIHFHPPVPESDQKVVIGMIHTHLPLP